MPRLYQIVITALLSVGGLFIVAGLWIPAKAIVAQHLLQYAWQKSLATGNIVKPWPWADTWPVGRLQNDRLGIDLIVLEGESGEVLAFGPGHLTTSSPPGKMGHCILAGHRDTSFHFLQKLKPGDRLTLQGQGVKRVYLVQSTEIALAEELYLDGGRTGVLTLITCYPFESVLPGGPLRFIVTAEECLDTMLMGNPGLG